MGESMCIVVFYDSPLAKECICTLWALRSVRATVVNLRCCDLDIIATKKVLEVAKYCLWRRAATRY